MFDLRNLLSGKNQLVGLDIGSSSLKLVEIRSTPKGYVLNRFSQIAVPRGLIVDGVLNEPEELSLKIKELFSLSRCGVKGVVISLSGHSVIVKKVSFNTMEEDELRLLIQDEAGKYLPFDNMEDVSFDFQIIGENEYNPNLMEVLLVAAKQDIVNNYVDALSRVGLVPTIMDVDSFALETMFEENYDFEPNEIDVLVNIGASITNINVVREGMSIFTRDFTLGGNTVTEAIQSQLGVTFDEAEQIKIEAQDSSQPAVGELGGDVLSFAEPICEEIERSIDYFRSTVGSEDIKVVLLSGGGAKIPGLAEELTRRLAIDTELINPFKKIGYDAKHFDEETIKGIGPVCAVGVGLALRRIGDK